MKSQRSLVINTYSNKNDPQPSNIPFGWWVHNDITRNCGKISKTHRIHVWYIYLHLPYKLTIHVGKISSPMDGMGDGCSPTVEPTPDGMCLTDSKDPNDTQENGCLEVFLPFLGVSFNRLWYIVFYQKVLLFR